MIHSAEGISASLAAALEMSRRRLRWKLDAQALMASASRQKLGGVSVFALPHPDWWQCAKRPRWRTKRTTLPLVDGSRNISRPAGWRAGDLTLFELPLGRKSPKANRPGRCAGKCRKWLLVATETPKRGLGCHRGLRFRASDRIGIRSAPADSETSLIGLIGPDNIISNRMRALRQAFLHS